MISTVIGLIYGFLFDINSTIKRMNFHNMGFISIVLQIVSHNFMISIIVICLSIFFYVGPSIPVITTYFIFGDSFAVVARKNGIFTALGTYPHFIFESIATLIILAIAFNISRIILDTAFSRHKKQVKNDWLLINFGVAIMFLVLGAVVEAIRIRL